METFKPGKVIRSKQPIYKDSKWVLFDLNFDEILKKTVVILIYMKAERCWYLLINNNK